MNSILKNSNTLIRSANLMKGSFLGFSKFNFLTFNKPSLINLNKIRDFSFSNQQNSINFIKLKKNNFCDKKDKEPEKKSDEVKKDENKTKSSDENPKNDPNDDKDENKDKEDKSILLIIFT